MFFDTEEGKVITLFIILTLVTVIFVFFLIGSLIRLKNRHVKQEKAFLHSLIDERERTMFTISSEIHDNINQLLSLARMSVSMINKSAIPEQQQYLNDCGTILDTTLGALRNISHSLNSKHIKEQGLLASLQQELEWINTSKNIHCELDIKGHCIPMEKDVELMIVRIAQEAILNVIKHSQAQDLLIGITYEKYKFSMIISDNGIGFLINQENPWGGYGLKSMLERTKIIKGDINMHSVPNLGTRIELELKHPQKARLSI